MTTLSVGSYACATVARMERPAKEVYPIPSRLLFPSYHSLTLKSVAFSTACYRTKPRQQL